MTLDKKLLDVLRNHKEDINEGRFAPVIADAYLQGGAKCVGGIKGSA